MLGSNVERGFHGLICLVTSHSYPDSKLAGGEETFLNQYTEYLAARNVPFTVVTASSHPKETGLEPVYIRPFAVPLLEFEVYSFLWVCMATMTIVKLHSQRRISAIHSVETGYAGLVGVFAARLLRIPLIVHSHGMRSEGLRKIRNSMGDWRAWLYWGLERSIDSYVANRATKVIAVSGEVAAFIGSFGVPESRISVVPSAVEYERYQKRSGLNLRSQLGIQDDCFVMGYLGRLARMKGVEVLIDAFSRFTKMSSGKSCLLIAGEGPLRVSLEAEVRRRRLAGVRFLGFQWDVAPFLCSLNAFVLPSFIEGSPISLLEAMAAGCPVIASDIHAVKEIAEGSALLFPPGDSEKLAELLLQLEHDGPLQRSLSIRARGTSHRYSTSVIFPRILAIYGESWN